MQCVKVFTLQSGTHVQWKFNELMSGLGRVGHNRHSYNPP